MSNDVEIETIDHLDFDFELLCEHSQHDKFHKLDQAASWLARCGACPNCGNQTQKSRDGYLICDEGRQLFYALGDILCMKCWIYLPTEEWKFVFTPLNG